MLKPLLSTETVSSALVAFNLMTITGFTHEPNMFVHKLNSAVFFHYTLQLPECYIKGTSYVGLLSGTVIYFGGFVYRIQHYEKTFSIEKKIVKLNGIKCANETYEYVAKNFEGNILLLNGTGNKKLQNVMLTVLEWVMRFVVKAAYVFV